MVVMGVQERRILMVAQERDTVSAAVHAAAALIHPLRWQQIYLPLLPLALKVPSSSHLYLHFLLWTGPFSTQLHKLAKYRRGLS